MTHEDSGEKGAWVVDKICPPGGRFENNFGINKLYHRCSFITAIRLT
jgi:hypothetical protein